MGSGHNLIPRHQFVPVLDEQAEQVGRDGSNLNSLVLFPPDDTASNLDPGDWTKAKFPQFGHGSIKLTVLFNDPSDPE